jgi:hypothetical protein
MTRKYLLAAALLAAGAVSSASAEPIAYTVDCAKGQTIGAALARGDARKPLTVYVRGTCSEYVHITRDDVTLIGMPPGGAVSGPGNAAPAIHIQADRVFLQDLDVSGGGTGVVIVGGPFLASMTRVVVHHPASGAAVVVRQGELALDGCTVTNGANGLQLARGGTSRVIGGTEIRDNSGSGIYLSGNSTVVVGSGTKILNNGQHGIQLEDGSQGGASGTEIAGNRSGVQATLSTLNLSGGNNIHDNREHGVVVVAGAEAIVSNNSIVANGLNGIIGYMGAGLVLHGNDIAGNGESGVYCRADCTLQVSGANIHDNAHHAVLVMLGSRAFFVENVTTATGNGWDDLWCGDSETSVDGVDGLSVDGGDFFDGSVSASCTGFND